jgi:c-di-GMP-binding flagellar brake protein YcgR
VSYASRVEDFDAERILVQTPSKKGQNVVLALNEPVAMSVRTADGATLYLDTEVMARIPPSADNPVPLLALRVLSVGRQQQRGHFRLNISMIPIDVALWERSLGEADGAWKPISAAITDLSGGGVGLSCDHEVAEGSRLRVRFPYPMGEGDFVADARVRKALGFGGSAGGRKFRVGTEFEELDRMRRERLTRCIFRYQIEQRRREKERIS